jgi:galactokinase
LNTTNKKNEIISIAPARTCLFGDHQDYLGLPVIACAISRYITLTATANDEKAFHIKMPDIHSERTILINNQLNYFDKGDYLKTALVVAREYGCIPDRGYNILITGNIPVNSGISSSSAFLVAWVRFLLEAYGSNNSVTPELIAKIAYEAEVEKQSGPGGKMDQYSISLGNIMYLETDHNSNYELFPKKIPGLIVGESGIPKDTLGVLSDLRFNATRSIEIIKSHIKGFDIKEADVKELSKYMDYLSDDQFIYFQAALINYSITKKALDEFRKAEIDFKKLGLLMNEHHLVLKNMLKITVPRIDAMIQASLNNGAYGAKIVGSGGGGSIVVLAPVDKQEAVVNAILDAGAVKAYVVEVDSGARILNS